MWVPVLASNDASMVVKKKDASSFRDVELAALMQEYRASIGWKTRANNATSVQESLSPAWILYDRYGRPWIYVFRSDYWHKR